MKHSTVVIEPIKIDDNFKEIFLAVLDNKYIKIETKEKIVKDFFTILTI